MANCHHLVAQAAPTHDLVSMLSQSYHAIPDNVLGSCTAILACVNDTRLNVLNIGDSGLMVCRRSKFTGLYEELFHTESGVHSFNHPHQLSSNKIHSYKPEDGLLVSVGVMEGDIMVVGTDGLWDNVFRADVLDMLGIGEENPEDIATRMAMTAQEIGHSSSSLTPFMLEAPSKYKVKGGKLDDITVVVCKLVKHSELPSLPSAHSMFWKAPAVASDDERS